MLLHFLALLMLSHSVFAKDLCISKSYKIEAWNYSGAHVFLKKSTTEPDGGSTINYFLYGLNPFTKETHTLSSRTKERGSIRETISFLKTVDTAAALNKSLKDTDFKAHMKTGWFTHYWSRKDLLEKHDLGEEKISLEKFDDTVKALDLNQVEGPLEIYSKDGARIVVVEKNNSCDAKCTLYFFSGDLKSLKKTYPCE